MMVYSSLLVVIVFTLSRTVFVLFVDGGTITFPFLPYRNLQTCLGTRVLQGGCSYWYLVLRYYQYRRVVLWILYEKK